MIPNLPNLHKSLPQYKHFLSELNLSGFSGDIKSDLGTRLIAATDNSVYQIMPQAVVAPKNRDDLLTLVALLKLPEFRTVKITPRGGGTGTNGQSLSDGIIIDLSRYFTEILELNFEAGWVRVQPGVILDQLNDFLSPFGVFFPPTVSTSSRATLGGMISTDASGKGSRIYGKTSQHILELESVLLDGTIHHSRSFSLNRLDEFKQQKNTIGKIVKLVDQIVTEKKELIKAKMPKMKRFITGYNLEKIVDEEKNQFNLNYMLAGSEGTLGFISEAKLKISPIPKYKRVFVAKYQNFEEALQDAEILINKNPSAIETVDDKILELAKDDEIYYRVKHMIGDVGKKTTTAINLIEYSADDANVLEQQINDLEFFLQQDESGSKAIGYFKPETPEEIEALWAFRKKGVGLLGNTKGRRRPIAFVEDTAVPPHNLSVYIKEFRAILEKHGLNYGMFGHVDVGCLHVRPALDMQDPKDEELLFEISDQIVQLVKKHGGVIWGEHGKGLRSEYSKIFFGEELYLDLRKIKGLFDPYNQLNPGKIATPIQSDDKVSSIRSQTRGQLDRTIDQQWQKQFETSITCNGNGACFNYQPNDVMCPSSKSTLDRIHSPKGRAGLLREWIRLLSAKNYRPDQSEKRYFSALSKPINSLLKKAGKYDYSHEVYNAMKGCLSCKACAVQCPVKVDISEIKSRFIELYHTRYLRPLRDHLVGNIETMAKYQSAFPRFFNFFFNQKLTQSLVKYSIGMVDLPALSELDSFQKSNIKSLTLSNPAKFIHSPNIKNTVIILQDTFTSFYDVKVLVSTIDLIQLLGFNVIVFPFFPNGKPFHIQGFLKRFKKTVERNHHQLTQLAATGIPLIGIDPAITLTYRDEYIQTLGIKESDYHIHLMQDWISGQLENIQKKNPDLPKNPDNTEKVYLFGHCTEKTAVFNALSNWEKIFNHFNIPIEVVPVGCCGMGGTYGHEKEKVSESRKIYEMSWGRKIAELQVKPENIMATGYSCRCQVKRFGKFRPAHPVEVLFRRLKDGSG
jgi:FAD/FMN-containing dehydrogenase/Fe-S oxidoreductase